jgi:hypothetical protein
LNYFQKGREFVRVQRNCAGIASRILNFLFRSSLEVIGIKTIMSLDVGVCFKCEDQRRDNILSYLGKIKGKL